MKNIDEIIEEMGDEDFERIFKTVWLGKHPKVYFIRSGGYVKIGFCESNLDIRVTELQVGNPEKIEFKYIVPGSKAIEKFIHRKLNKYRYRGEWFELNDAQLSKVCQESLSRNFDFRGLGQVKYANN